MCVVVKKLDDNSSVADVELKGLNSTVDSRKTAFVTDTGISKTIINYKIWREMKSQCTLVKTSKRFRPYGTHYHLPIIGRFHATLSAQNGADIKTWVYVLKNEQFSNFHF